MSQRIEDTLLVVQPFQGRNGTEYVPGDRLPIRHRWVRRLAAEHPQWFVMEYATEPLDVDWLASLEADSEARYETVKRLREAEKGQRKRALRRELKEQEAPQPVLERRFRQQERERERREQEAREKREREGARTLNRIRRRSPIWIQLLTKDRSLTKTKAPEQLQAREAIVITAGARPIEFQRRIVRDRRTGKLAEIDIHELPPG